jgi:hypothetical protein
MVCTEVPNQIKFVSRPHPTGSHNDFIYTDFVYTHPNILYENLKDSSKLGDEKGILKKSHIQQFKPEATDIFRIENPSVWQIPMLNQIFPMRNMGRLCAKRWEKNSFLLFLKQKTPGENQCFFKLVNDTFCIRWCNVTG